MKKTILTILFSALVASSLQTQPENLEASDIVKCITSANDLKQAVTKYVQEPGWFKGDDIGLIIKHLGSTLKYCTDADPDKFSKSGNGGDVCKETLSRVVTNVKKMMEFLSIGYFEEFSQVAQEFTQNLGVVVDQCF